jgi:hypothetical protein
MTAIMLSLLLPHLLEIVGALVALAVAWAAVRFHAWTGIQIQARHREALQSAIMTGVRAALARGIPAPQAVEHAIGYAQSSVPQAIAKLRPTEPVLHNLARAKLQEAQGGDR